MTVPLEHLLKPWLLRAARTLERRDPKAFLLEWGRVSADPRRALEARGCLAPGTLDSHDPALLEAEADEWRRERLLPSLVRYALRREAGLCGESIGATGWPELWADKCSPRLTAEERATLGAPPVLPTGGEDSRLRTPSHTSANTPATGGLEG